MLTGEPGEALGFGLGRLGTGPEVGDERAQSIRLGFELGDAVGLALTVRSLSLSRCQWHKRRLTLRD